MDLHGLAELLGDYAGSGMTLEALQQRFTPLLLADPLDVTRSDGAAWDAAHHDERLLWRLIYLFESETDDGDRPRRLAGRIVRCLRTTASAQATFELLPLLLDQERFCTIVARHRAGVISRTGFLSVLAESGYPDHIKLWMRHAPADALDHLCRLMETGAYDEVTRGFEHPPPV